MVKTFIGTSYCLFLRLLFGEQQAMDLSLYPEKTKPVVTQRSEWE
jgi:hypothetical protein